MKTHQVQQKTERRISAALRLVFVAALLLGQIALAFFLSTELRQRAAIIYTVLELAAFGYAVRIYNRTDGASYKFGWIFLVLTVPVVGAGTANTEFEVLTGMSSRFFGPGEYPFQTCLKDQTVESVAYDLKENGYATHAIHNHRAAFYSRNEVYPQSGL